jgi:hypothetical protein
MRLPPCSGATVPLRATAKTIMMRVTSTGAKALLFIVGPVVLGIQRLLTVVNAGYQPVDWFGGMVPGIPSRGIYRMGATLYGFTHVNILGIFFISG